MSLFLWVADMGAHPTGSQPVVSSVVTARSVNGTCVGSVCTVNAAAATTITCGPVNDGQYIVNLYENGSLVTTGSTGGFTYTKTFIGYSASGGAPYINPDLTYRADVVQISNGQVVSTKTGNEYTDMLGTCGGPL